MVSPYSPDRKYPAFVKKLCGIPYGITYVDRFTVLVKQFEFRAAFSQAMVFTGYGLCMMAS